MTPCTKPLTAVLAPEILPRATPHPEIPEYLQKVYWWAYLHPHAVRLFEREWLVNLILWGNFSRLRDAALAELDNQPDQRALQVACVYGDFTRQIGAHLGENGTLDVVDVAPIQLANLQRKLPADERIRLHRQDSSHLHFPDASFDSTLLFFLLHEQPEAVRRATLGEALRYVMKAVLKRLEPFATDLWQNEIAAYLPASPMPYRLAKTTCFGDLYQKVVITR